MTRAGAVSPKRVCCTAPAVAESVAIGVPDAVKGEGLVVVVRLVGPAGKDGIEDDVGDLVAGTLGRAFRPLRVLVVPALPKTRSGKLVRRVVRSAVLGEDVGDVSSLERPEVVPLIGAAA